MNVLNLLPTFRGGNCRVWISGRPLSRRVFSRKKPCLSKKDNRVQNMLNVKASAYAMSARDKRPSKDQLGLSKISQTLSNSRAKYRQVGTKYL